RRQRRERSKSSVLVAADREAKRKPTPRFVCVGPAQRRPIIRLRSGLLSEQIVGKAEIATDRRQARAELLRALEIGQRTLGVAVGYRHSAHTGLGQRAARVHVVGAGEET